jgi:VanZ family protein
MTPDAKPRTPRPRIAALLLGGWVASIALLAIEGTGAAAQREIPVATFAHADKLLHAAAWCWLALLLTPALVLLRPQRAKLAAAVSVCTNVAVGALIEVVQAGYGAGHGRSADLLDVVADATGACIGAVLAFAALRRLRKD